MIALVVITDGRQPQTISRAIDSAREHLQGIIACTIINDSADPDYAVWLDQEYSKYHRVHHVERRGLGGAVRSAWTEVLDKSHAQHIFHLEDDMVLTEDIDLGAMSRLLDANQHLAQLVLKRHPWSTEEIAAGGQIEIAPNEYNDHDGFVEHRVDGSALHVFSFNPCLIPRRVIQLCVDDRASKMLERDVTDTLLANGYRFAYYGARGDAPKVNHIGHSRSVGYRW